LGLYELGEFRDDYEDVWGRRKINC
jgi:hypothetical protein